jgi:hypothetical protein
MQKEKDAENNKGIANENTNLISETAGTQEEDIALEDITPELKDIKYQEKYHFTGQRMSFILLNFLCLFATQFLYGGKGSFKLPQWGRQLVLIAFIITMLLMTVFAVMKINRLHEIKARDGYKFDANDTKFEKVSDIAALAFFCMIAAVLCGCTGIAGGMVLGPLFLKYNMIP